MIAYFYEFSKRKNSTERPVIVSKQYDIHLKQPTSITDPVIVLQDDWSNFNYFYIPQFTRMYFVTGTRSLSDSIFEVSGHVDTLATYREIIRSMFFFVERSSVNYDMRFNDPCVSVTQRIVSRNVATTPLGFSTNNGCWIVRIAGGDADGVSTYAVSTLARLAGIFNKDNYYQTTDDDWTKMVGNFVFDPYDYVVDLFYSPLNYSVYEDYGTTSEIKVKWFGTGITALKLNNRAIKTINKPIDIPSNIYSDFRKYNPTFSKYNISIPAVGLIDLNNNDIDNLKISYVINLDTGASGVYLSNSATLTQIASYQTNIYTSVQYGNTAQSLGQIAGGVLNLAGAVMSKNIPMGISAGINTMENILHPTPSIGGSNGGASMLYNTSVLVSVENFGSGEIDTANWGRPLNKVVQLNSLMGGFIKCGGASANISCYDSEREELNNYLNNGFYLE